MYRRILCRLISNINFEKDYYKVLGLNKNASHQDIRKAYLNLAKQLHPDAPTGNEEKFKQLGEAYEVLGNEKSRKEYDTGRSSGATGDSQSRQYQQYYQQRTRRRPEYGEDPFQQWEDFFRQQQNMHNQSRQKQQEEHFKQQQKRSQGYQEYSYYEYINPFTGQRFYFYRPNKNSTFREDFFKSSRDFDPFENFYNERPFRESFGERRRRMYEARRMQEMEESKSLFAELLGGAVTVTSIIIGIFLLSGFLRLLRGPPPPPSDPYYFDETYPPPHSRRSPYSRDDYYR